MPYKVSVFSIYKLHVSTVFVSVNLAPLISAYSHLPAPVPVYKVTGIMRHKVKKWQGTDNMLQAKFAKLYIN